MRGVGFPPKFTGKSQGKLRLLQSLRKRRIK